MSSATGASNVWTMPPDASRFSYLLDLQHQFLGLPLEGAGIDGGDGHNLTRYVAWDSPRARAEAPSPVPEGVTAQFLARLVPDDHPGSGHALTATLEQIGLAINALERDVEGDYLPSPVGSRW